MPSPYHPFKSLSKKKKKTEDLRLPSERKRYLVKYENQKSPQVLEKKRKIVLPGGLFISSPFEVGLIDTGGIKRGGLFSLAKAMTLVLRKKIECKVEMVKYKRLKVMQPKIKTNPSFQVVNNSSWISPHEVLQSTVNTVYHSFIEE